MFVVYHIVSGIYTLYAAYNIMSYLVSRAICDGYLCTTLSVYNYYADNI